MCFLGFLHARCKASSVSQDAHRGLGGCACEVSGFGDAKFRLCLSFLRFVVLKPLIRSRDLHKLNFEPCSIIISKELGFGVEVQCLGEGGGLRLGRHRVLWSRVPPKP